MRFRLLTVHLLAFALMLGFLVQARAQAPDAKPDADKKTKFLRIQRNDKKEAIALETAIVHYVPASGEKGVELDLVAVVHVGDKDYYEKLNKAFEKYDVVLFELVARPGAQIPKGGPKNSDSPLAMVQQLAKLALELELQLEQIDYTKKNFVHADLSPDQMAKAIKERGDDGLTLTLSVVADMLRQQNLKDMKRDQQPRQDADIDIAGILLDPDRGVKLKRMMAEQFEQLDNPDAGFGKTINQILVKDRNKAALKVFQQQLAQGKKKVAIFYGAAHMPDFEKRLKEDFGLKRQGQEWLQAWDLRPGAKKMGIEDLLKKLLDDCPGRAGDVSPPVPEKTRALGRSVRRASSGCLGMTR